MTNVTKVGVSYDNHMNDDAPEVDSFFRGCYQALSSPRFLRREPGDEATWARAITPVQYRVILHSTGIGNTVVEISTG